MKGKHRISRPFLVSLALFLGLLGAVLTTSFVARAAPPLKPLPPDDPWELALRANNAIEDAASPEAPSAPAASGSAVWLWAGGGTLYDVAFAGDAGWLAGWDGTMGHTTDGGQHWSGQYAGITDTTLYGIATADADHVWAVAYGYDGAILHSWNGGEAWVEQASSGNWSFQNGEITFVDADTGWAVGADWSIPGGGLILHTDDSGANWSRQTSGTSNPLYGVAFADANNGWAVGDFGTIRYTSNGGATWITQTSGTMEPLNDVFALDDQTAWAVGDNWGGNPQATILRTTDGGSNWVTTTNTTVNVGLQAVAFADANHGWAVGNDATILYTSDGGDTWTEQNSGVPYNYGLYGVSVITATGTVTEVVVVGDHGALLRTTDGGATWTPWSPIATLHDVDFVNASKGWIVGGNMAYGENETISYTTDGGLSWNTPQDLGVMTAALKSVSFVDESNGYAVGKDPDDDGVILRTTNGGVTWTQGIAVPSVMELYGVDAVDATHAWASGLDYVYGTTNGITWTRQYTSVWYLYGVDFVSTTHGWVASEGSGAYGRVLHTDDGGANWSVLWTNINAPGLRDVTMWDAQTGWAVGEGADPQRSLIVRTTNGLTWTKQYPPIGMYKDLEGVVFTSTTEGWAVGETATVLHTEDGGSNWETEATQSSAWLYGVAYDGSDLWAVGDHSTILKRAIIPAPPTADFSATPRLGGTPLTVNFSDASTGSPTAWWWDFGDGATSTEQNPSHVYNTPGSYTVTLTAINSGGSDSETKTGYVTINPPCYGVTGLEISGPASITSGLSAVFTATVTQPPSVTLPLTYTWQATGKSDVVQTGYFTRTTISFTWHISGHKQVTVTTQDCSKLSVATHSVTVTVPNPPVADFVAAPRQGDAPLTVIFTDTSTGSPTAWLWDFGDGTTSDSQHKAYDYDTPGVYTVTLTVTNTGGSDSEVKPGYITVTQPCEAVAGVTIDGPTTGVTNTNYVFTATVAPPNASPPITFTWQATDKGELVKLEIITQTNTSFSWNTGGVKHITVTAENCGSVVSTTHVITLPFATCGDLYEPNETFADAYLLDPLDPAGYHAYICYPTDQDYLGFNASLGDVMTLTLDSLPKNYDLELWDPAGDLVGFSYNGSTAPEQIQFLASNWSGEYRARVMGAGGEYDEWQPYHLTIVVTTTAPQTLTVNTTDDLDDGVCDATHCSLREAINTCNAGDEYKITFNIPVTDTGFDWLVWTISPTTSLPTITQKIDLDATTQAANQGNSNPNGPEIVLDGSVAGGGNGLALTAGSTIRGLAIYNWSDGAGIYAEGTIQTKIYGCYIGTNHFGTSAAPNQDGVVIVGGHSVYIGGSGEGNLISGNSRYGVHLSGTAYAQIRANYIGTDRTGMAALGNSDHGVYLSDGAEWNTLGGDRGTEGNLISGNGGDGVHITGSESGYNKLWGNYIGINATVTGTLRNDSDGIQVSSGHHTTIGDVDSGKGNVIGGNGEGGPLLDNGRGIYLSGANQTTIAGNFIGAEPDGIVHLGNYRAGVHIEGGARFNTVGPGNVVAHNGGAGVRVYGATTTRNTITQNSITDNSELGIENEEGGNIELLPPIIAHATTTYVEGVACSRCRVEVFGDPDGEGENYDGVVTATVSGDWTWSGSPSQGPTNATATATDSDGNTSEFTICYDEYEPNNDFDHAAAVGSEAVVYGYTCHSDDQDYYRFSVTAPAVITLELTAPAVAWLRLYSPDHALLGETNTVGGGTKRITHITVASGDYFIRVNPYGDEFYDPDNPYTLDITTRGIESELDFEAFGLEVTQAVQDLNNSVLLVSNKRTFARLHVRSLAFGDLGPVTARLRAWRGSHGLGVIFPSNPGGAITVREDPDRGELEHSFYFDLPDSWLRGSVRLTAEINHDHAVLEGNYANNTQTADVTFQETPEMHLRIVDICYITNTVTYRVRDQDPPALESWLRRAYPIDRLNVRQSALSPCYDHAPSASEINADLAEARSLNLLGDDSEYPYMRYYGLVDDGYWRTTTSCWMRGLASGIQASGPAGDPARCVAWDTDDSYADWYGGHELGHTYGRRHTRGTQPPGCAVGSTCCGREGGNEVVYPDGDISPTRDESDPDALYGFDVETLDIYPPSWKDVMTYCDFEWMSDHTYEGIHSKMITETGRAAAMMRPAAPQEYLAVFGTVYSDTDEVELETFYRLPDAWDVLERTPGEYSIRLLDGAEGTLADYPFAPHFENLDAGASCQAGEADVEVPGLIAVYVPWVTDTVRIAIYHGTQELASRLVSAHAPQVTLTYPNGGEVLDGAQITVTWDASDLDGEALSYVLEYSVDDGARWQVLGTGIHTTTLLLDAAVVPGTAQGKFRIRASDGVNTAQDESNGVFTVPNKTPQVQIVSPPTEASYLQGQSVALVAYSIDLEDGTLGDAALAWASNLDGAVGTGLMVHVTDLSTGTHTLTLTATDSGGGAATDAITIAVSASPTALNLAPYEPSDPTPANGAEGVSLDQTLSWQGGDPNGDPVSYTVSLGTAGQPPITAIVTNTSWNPGSLQPEMTYTWTVTASDGIDVTAGPVWTFTTASAQPCVALTDVDITTASPTTTINVVTYFTATALPGSLQLPVTYTWTADDQQPVDHFGMGLSDIISFTWTVTGTKTITAAAVNECSAVISDTYVISVEPMPYYEIYLPLVIRGFP